MPLSEHYTQIRQKIGPSLMLVPGVAAVVRDETGRILFQRKPDGTWSLPAGAIEPGENPAQAIVREAREETGLEVNPERVIGIFGGRGFRYQYSNGDEVEYTIVLFERSLVRSTQQFDGEETEQLEYFALEEMPVLQLDYPRAVFSPSQSSATYFETANERNVRPS